MMSNMMYRTDSGAALNQYFNPYVQGVALQSHRSPVGENVRFVDLYDLFTPGNSQSILSSDGSHPTQAGYNQIANAWYASLVYGAAYWTGSQDTNWNTVNGTSTNWAMDRGLTTGPAKITH